LKETQYLKKPARVMTPRYLGREKRESKKNSVEKKRERKKTLVQRGCGLVDKKLGLTWD